MISKVAKEHDILTVEDNTFATPYFLRPIEHGIDIVYTQQPNTLTATAMS